MRYYAFRMARAMRVSFIVCLLIVSLSVVSSAQDSPQGLDPFTVTTNISVLRAEAARTGSLRVIVGVRADYSGVSGLDGVSADAGRRQISQSAQNTVLGALRAAGHTVQVERQFWAIPYMVLTVDAAALDALAAHPQVTSIQNDALSAPAMNSSAGVIGASGPGGAWAMGYTGNGLAVAVLDTGVDKAHPALSSRVVSEACYNRNDVSTGSSSRCPGGVQSSTVVGSGVDCTETLAIGCEHGTHVAGTVASTDTTYRGIAYGANLIAINVFSLFPSGPICGSVPCVLSWISDQIKGLERVYALRNTYSIAAVNMSLSGNRYFSNCDADYAATKAIIDQLRSANIATVIASGNDGYRDSMGAPACISSAISVGATTDGDVVAGFSNSANFLHLLAPGVSITSAKAGTTGFQTYNGTSMATPHVAAAWAVIRQAAPSMSVTEVLNLLKTTGVPVTDTRSGAGNRVKPRIQLNDALNAILNGGEGVELLFNGDFDIDEDDNLKLPDGWAGVGLLLGDKVMRDGAQTFAFSAPNAFRFRGRPNEAGSMLRQRVNLSEVTILAGDTLDFSAMVDQRSGLPNSVIGRLVIRYTDGAPNTVILLRLPAVSTPGYVKVEAPSFTVSNSNIGRIVVQLMYRPTTGAVFLDDVSLILTQNSFLNAADGLLPLPAPADLRGQ